MAGAPALIPHVLGLWGCALAVAGAARALRIARRPWLLAAIAAGGLAPVEGLPLLAHLRGLIGDLSVSTLVLASLLLARPESFSRRSRVGLRVVFFAGGVVLYPGALGFWRWDAYALGYGPELPAALLAVSAALWFTDRRGAALALMAGAAAHGLSLLASRNLWDYVLDPVLFYACLVLGARDLYGNLRLRLANSRQPSSVASRNAGTTSR